MAAAHSKTQDDIEWSSVVTGLVGGVALLSFSMSLMSHALRAATAGALKGIIRAACANVFTGILSGAVVTAVLTSATAASMLVLEFVSSGDMTVAQALGVCLGVNIGSTLNAHLVAFKLSAYWLWPIAGGYVVSLLIKSPVVKHVADVCTGLGLLFHAVHAISAAIAPLRTYGPFLAFLARMDNMLLALVVSGVSAVLLQSSNTVMAIAIALAQQGFISLDVALYFVLGSNVGTCISAIIAAVGKPVDSMRVAVAYLVMKAVGVAVLLPFLATFRDVVEWASPSASAFSAAAVLPKQIANAHTLVNVWVAVLFVPLLEPLNALLTRFIAAPKQRVE